MIFLRNFLNKIGPNFFKGGKLENFYPLYEAADTFLFTPGTRLNSPPYVRDSVDIKRIMFFVIIAMLPALLSGIYNVGYQINSALNLVETFMLGLPVVLPIVLVSYTVGGFWEVLFSIIRKHEINEGFLVTGMLIPLTMPIDVPLWMLALSVIFAVVIGKEVF